MPVTVAKETLAELSVPATSTFIIVLAAALSDAVINPIIGAVAELVPPLEIGRIPFTSLSKSILELLEA